MEMNTAEASAIVLWMPEKEKKEKKKAEPRAQRVRRDWSVSFLGGTSQV